MASRGTPELTWEKSVLLKGDAAAAVAALKQTEGRQLQVHGSGDLVQTLLAAGLVDRWHLVIHPVLLGSGRRLFADGTVPASLRLVDGSSDEGRHPAGHVRAGRRRGGGQLRLIRPIRVDREPAGKMITDDGDEIPR